MTVINLIHLEDKVLDMDALSGEEKSKIAGHLSCQALEALGYILEGLQEDEALRYTGK